ncbi:MAG: MerR family transcriptional regulator [Haloechinothrix sp.]
MPSERAAGNESSAVSDAANAALHDRAGDLAGDLARDLARDSAAEPTLPVAAVARRLGVAPATLRTWDRRYGLGPSGHTNGRHRRYAPVDITCLEVMQRALLSGASTAEAAQFAIDSVKVTDPPVADVSDVVPAQPTGRDEPVPLHEHPGSSRLARRLSAAALAMDVRMVRQLLDDAIGAQGPLLAWEEVIRPVLTAVAAGWRNSRSGPEAEYLLAEFALVSLVRATPELARPRNHHPVLLAAPPEERGNLAPYALAAELAAHRIDPLVIGGWMPVDVLAATVRRTSPAAVVLCSGRPRSANPLLFARLARGRQHSRLFACGSGWDVRTLPAQVEHIADPRDVIGRVGYVLLGVTPALS